MRSVPVNGTKSSWKPTAVLKAKWNGAGRTAFLPRIITLQHKFRQVESEKLLEITFSVPARIEEKQERPSSDEIPLYSVDPHNRIHYSGAEVIPELVMQKGEYQLLI